MTRSELEDLARAVAPLVARELARIVATGGLPTTYSTRRGRAPEGYARDAWSDLARRIGMKRGRWYVVTHEQLAAYEAAQKAPPMPSPLGPWHPSEAAASLGLRPTRKARLPGTR